MQSYVERVIKRTETENPGQPTFHQAVGEVLATLKPVLERHPELEQWGILERLTHPDRAMVFNVTWIDGRGKVQVNRGYRVQGCNVLGPYKGGLRFHPTVDLGVMKFLAFEQVFKNALTGLSLGGAKGGSDFDPKGRSDLEVMRFCQAFMGQLFPHIGATRDVPAGDIGVGAREIGYLFGEYRRLAGHVEGALTGKGLEWGGSHIRPEATGYGAVYFAQEMLAIRGEGIEGKTAVISGSGNAALYAAEKLIELGARVATMSDSGGTIHDPDGIDAEKLAWLKELKEVRRGRIREYASQYPAAEHREGRRPWDIKCEMAFPCATENELDGADASVLVGNGCICVSEGANMPTDHDAIQVFREAEVLHGPGKAANAGGVAVSGLEMAQNASHTQWTREVVDGRLQEIMRHIHGLCAKTAAEYDRPGDLVFGANAAGFLLVAQAMIEQGV